MLLCSSHYPSPLPTTFFFLCSLPASTAMLLLLSHLHLSVILLVSHSALSAHCAVFHFAIDPRWTIPASRPHWWSPSWRGQRVARCGPSPSPASTPFAKAFTANRGGGPIRPTSSRSTSAMLSVLAEASAASRRARWARKRMGTSGTPPGTGTSGTSTGSPGSGTTLSFDFLPWWRAELQFSLDGGRFGAR